MVSKWFLWPGLSLCQMAKSSFERTRKVKEQQTGKAAVLELATFGQYVRRCSEAVPLLIGTGLGLTSPRWLTWFPLIFLCDCHTVATTVNKFSNRFAYCVGLCHSSSGTADLLISSDKGVAVHVRLYYRRRVFVVLIASVFSKIKKLSRHWLVGDCDYCYRLDLDSLAMPKWVGRCRSRKLGIRNNLLLAFITIALIIGVQVFAKGFIRSISVLIGLVGGSVLAYFMGLVDFAAIGHAPVFRTAAFIW